MLVDELLDVLRAGHRRGPDAPEALKKARQRLLVAHPLQPFSPVAFDMATATRACAASTANWRRRCAGSLAAPVPLDSAAKPGDEERDIEIDPDDENAVIEPARLFFTAPLAAPGDEWREVSLEQLIEFFRNPSRYLLAQRMRISLPWTEDELEDDEPFLPDVAQPLPRWPTACCRSCSPSSMPTARPCAVSPPPAPSCPMARSARWCWIANWTPSSASPKTFAGHCRPDVAAAPGHD